MKAGRVSRTAVKVAYHVLSLAQERIWQARLPEGIAETTERLLLAAGPSAPPPRRVELAKRPWVGEMYAYLERFSPGAYTGVGWRKIFMNDAVVRALFDGARQVLVVGAGFDTLCLRLAPQHREVLFVEIDHPATSDAKRRGVDELGAPGNLELLAADLSEVFLSKVMSSCSRWEPQARSVVVVEGVFLYLTEQQVAGVFDEISRCTGPRTRVAFSHLLDLQKTGALSRWGLRLIGEPWLSSKTREELPDWLSGLGWTVIDQDAPRSDRDLEGFAVAEKT
jgi:methyltransferase (TIGR00027 family)